MYSKYIFEATINGTISLIHSSLSVYKDAINFCMKAYFMWVYIFHLLIKILSKRFSGSYLCHFCFCGKYKKMHESQCIAQWTFLCEDIHVTIPKIKIWNNLTELFPPSPLTPIPSLSYPMANTYVFSMSLSLFLLCLLISFFLRFHI